MRKATRSSLVCLILTGLASTAMAEKLWVIAERSRRIWIVDTDTNQRETSPIAIGDPDSDGTLDTPRGIQFSTTLAEPGTKALVAQGPLVTVIDVASRAVQWTTDVSLLTNQPTLQLTGIATAAPRRFFPGSGAPVTRTFIYLAGTIPAAGVTPAKTVWIVLDQPRVLAHAGNELVANGDLASGYSGASVTVLDTADGSNYQRAWYTLIDDVAPARVAVALLHTTKTSPVVFRLDRPTERAVSGTLAPPLTLRVGAPGTGELPVMPWWGSSELQNLQHDFSCGFSGRPTAVAVSGPGVGSYTTFVTDTQSNRLVALDPGACSHQRSFTTGRYPMSIAVLGGWSWTSVFTANREEDTVTRVNRSGSVVQIPLGLPGSNCNECPTDAGFPFASPCVIAGLDVDRAGSRLDLNWESELCAVNGYDVFCRCMDSDLDCPCSCVCEPGVVPPFDCECPPPAPPAVGSTAGTDAFGDSLLPELPVIPSKNGWIRIGQPPTPMLSIDGYADADFQAAFTVEGSESPIP